MTELVDLVRERLGYGRDWTETRMRELGRKGLLICGHRRERTINDVWGQVPVYRLKDTPPVS